MKLSAATLALFAALGLASPTGSSGAMAEVRDIDRRCGVQSTERDKECPPGFCCSSIGYCGRTPDHCGKYQGKDCQKDFGTCYSFKARENQQCGIVPGVYPFPAVYLGCAEGLCCSSAGYCGSTPEHCGSYKGGNCQPNFGRCDKV